MPPWWSQVEDALLRRLYAEGATLEAIAAELGRSVNGVSERRRLLDIPPRARARPWSSREDELLRAASLLGIPASAVAERLDRPAEQVRRRRRVLVGRTAAARPYDIEEDQAITACWSAGGDVEQLADKLGRSPGSVRLRAQKLGLHRPAPRARWRPDEDAVVRDGYDRGLTCVQIADEIGSRTPSAVAARAAKLGLATYARTWTPADDRLLRRLVEDRVDLERAAQALTRTPDAVRSRARKLGITPPRPNKAGRAGRPWASAEDEVLELHRGLNPAALAVLLDRSPEAISQRLRRLGLRRGAERSPHHAVGSRRAPTPGERAAVVREMRGSGPARELALARRLNLRPADIRQLAREPASDGRDERARTHHENTPLRPPARRSSAGR